MCHFKMIVPGFPIQLSVTFVLVIFFLLTEKKPQSVPE